MSKHFNTEKPRLTEATIARIRTDARRYLLAGGGMFLGVEDAADRDEHIGNVRERLQPGLSESFEAGLKEYVPDHKAHEALWSVVWELAGAAAEAGFAFGVAVGCEVAAQTLGVGVKVAR
jgi:hypothetical protein